jgi:ribosomal protein S18 acetylase RimI-like enzyme
MHRPTPPGAVLEVREATRQDLRATARLHRERLPDGFFSELGAGFLRRYHASFLASPHGVALVAVDTAREEVPVGFLVGTLRNRAHYRWVLHRCGLQLAARLLAALVARPRLAWSFARTRAGRYLRWVGRYPLRGLDRRRGTATTPPTTAATDRPETTPPAPVAVLTHVAVDPAARGLGAGRRLVEAFVARAEDDVAAEVRLVTAAGGDANGFYERLGWTAAEERCDADGGAVREYRKRLRSRAA